MKIITSSKALHKILEGLSEKEVLNYRLVDGGMEFETAIDGVQWMGCETQFYRPNKDIYNWKIPFDKKQWKKIKDTLRDYFPEQPITIEFEDDEIRINHCVLVFK
jgi:hypothetical protein